MFHQVVDGGEEELDNNSPPIVVLVNFLTVGEIEDDANHLSREVGVACGHDGGWFTCHVIGP